MAQRKAERCINPSEEGIQLGQLRGHFLVSGDSVATVAFSGFGIEVEIYANEPYWGRIAAMICKLCEP
jgi:hypothetical protein